jgi:rod shape-determining protein MreB
MIGQQTSEAIKKQIGNAHPSVKTMAMEVKGLHQGDGLPRTLRITSDEIREALEEPLASIVGALKGALEQTPPELAADIVDRGIVLTGGGSLLKGIEERFKDETNLPVNLVDDPLTCVVLGAGKILDNLDEYEQVVMQGAES